MGGQAGDDRRGQWAGLGVGGERGLGLGGSSGGGTPSLALSRRGRGKFGAWLFHFTGVHRQPEQLFRGLGELTEQGELGFPDGLYW